jgi:hypothetical protein
VKGDTNGPVVAGGFGFPAGEPPENTKIPATASAAIAMADAVITILRRRHAMTPPPVGDATRHAAAVRHRSVRRRRS